MGHLGREKKKGERKEEKEERRRKKKEEKKEKREEERKKKKKHLRSLRPRWPRPRRAEAPSSAEHAGLFFFFFIIYDKGFSPTKGHSPPQGWQIQPPPTTMAAKSTSPPTHRKIKSRLGVPLDPRLSIFLCVGGDGCDPAKGVFATFFWALSILTFFGSHRVTPNGQSTVEL